MAFSIFAHSIRLVFNQWREALMIAGVLYISTTVIGIISMAMMGPLPEPGSGVAPNLWAILPSGVISLVAFIWIAVEWHRYILLNQPPNSFMPQIHGDRVWAYLGKLLLTVLIAMPVVLVVVVIVTLISVAANAPILAMAGSVLALLVVLVVTYRLAPLLPAAAVGQKLSVGQAWKATRGATGAFIVLAIISGIASVLIDVPGTLIGRLPLGAIPALIWLTATGLVKTLVGVSILTTIYGHYVEGRPIT